VGWTMHIHIVTNMMRALQSSYFLEFAFTGCYFSLKRWFSKCNFFGGLKVQIFAIMIYKIANKNLKIDPKIKKNGAARVTSFLGGLKLQFV